MTHGRFCRSVTGQSDSHTSCHSCTPSETALRRTTSTSTSHPCMVECNTHKPHSFHHLETGFRFAFHSTCMIKTYLRIASDIMTCSIEHSATLRTHVPTRTVTFSPADSFTADRRHPLWIGNRMCHKHASKQTTYAYPLRYRRFTAQSSVFVIVLRLLRNTLH